VPEEAFDLTTTFVHLGLGARVIPLADFEWTTEYLERYEAETAADGIEGRLVTISSSETNWPSWERHPSGDELVVLLSGRLALVQDLRGDHHRVHMEAGRAVINPKCVWHTADVYEPSRVLFITPGRGTEHKPR